jgi:endonuclease/exonuclease/phosphatase family metal-dependent hydrolase
MLNNELRILTLNTWLLETPIFSIPIASDVKKRLQKLPQLILETKADIVFLQEVWKKKFVNLLHKELSPFGYSTAYENSSLFQMGNGLLTISKFPFANHSKGQKVKTHTFRDRTRLDEHAVKKGITMCSVNLPNQGEVKLFNTHLGATTLDKKLMQPKLNHYKKRSNQLTDVANFVKENTSSQDPYILAGDFNVNEHCFINKKEESTTYTIEERHDPAYKSIMNKLEIVDTFRTANSKFSPKDDNYLGYTVNADLNPYVNGGINKSFAKFGRIDYIFLSQSAKATVDYSRVVFQPLRKEKPSFAISDHFGVLTKIKF